MFTGIFVPTWLLVRPEVTTSAKHVYSLLAWHARGDGVAFPSQGRLAIGLGISERNVRNSLAQLETYGLLECEGGGRGGLKYFFVWHPWMEGENTVTGKFCRIKQQTGKVAQTSRQSGTNNTANLGKHIDKELREERREHAQARATQGAALARRQNPGDEMVDASSFGDLVKMLTKGRA